MKLLWDGDMLVFRMAAAVEERSPFNKEIVLSADPEDAWSCVELRIAECERIVMEHFDIPTCESVLCFSSPTNYRKTVDPNYKGNRKGKSKPIVYNETVDRCKRNYPWEEWENIEADDIMGILQTEDTIIVTGDKDLNQIEGYHLNLIDPEAGVYSTTAEEGMRMFWEQCLSGDSVDGYYGCPQIGKKKAQGILSASGSWSNPWSLIVNAYKAAMSPKSRSEVTEGGKKRTVKLKSYNLGLGEKEALMTARCAYILRNEDEYNKETGEVNLWEAGES